MKYKLLLLIIFCFSIQRCDRGNVNSISKIEMHLSPLGVESDNFPDITAIIDLKNNVGNCKKFYYDPKYKGSSYSLSKSEINSIKSLLNNSSFKSLKSKYSVTDPDQPTSTMKIYTDKKVFLIEDYGLKGEYPLNELYKMVYKLK